MTIRLTPDEEARLNVLAQRTGRTKSFYVRTAVQTYLEDTYAADEAMRKFNASGRVSRPISEVVGELGLTEADIDEGRALNQAADT